MSPEERSAVATELDLYKKIMAALPNMNANAQLTDLAALLPGEDAQWTDFVQGIVSQRVAQRAIYYGAAERPQPANVMTGRLGIDELLYVADDKPVSDDDYEEDDEEWEGAPVPPQVPDTVPPPPDDDDEDVSFVVPEVPNFLPPPPPGEDEEDQAEADDKTAE
jgi:hypothetical protein